MHIAWLIIKIILLTLGILLGLLLVLLLLLLFVPFRYRVDGQFTENVCPDVKVRVSWMSFFLDFRAHYGTEKGTQGPEAVFCYELRSFWVLLATNDESRLSKRAASKKSKRKKKAHVSSDSGHAEPVIKTEEQIPLIDASESEQIFKPEPWESSPGGQLFERIWAGIRSWFRIMEFVFTLPARLVETMFKLWRRLQHIMESFRDAVKALLSKLKLINRKREQLIKLYELSTTKTAIKNCKQYVCCLLSHLKPKKLSGDLTLGMEDPADTGKIFGFLGLLLPVYYDNIKLTAYFEGKKLTGDIHMKGGITIAFLLWLLLKIYRDKYTMKTYERLKKILGGGRNHGK